MGGLADSTRKWYQDEIMKILRKYGKVSVSTLMYEMHKSGQSRYPIQEERICSFLKYLRACGLVTYYPSKKRKISPTWEAR